MITSIPRYCTVSTLHRQSQFVLKMKRLHYVSVENHMREYCQGFFHLILWNLNIKAINITKLVQMIFKAWLGSFEYVGYLLRGIMLIVLDWCLNLIAINFNWSTSLWSIVQREISSTKLRKPLLTCLISHSTFSMNWTNLFCVFQLRFYLSWNNKT